VALQDQLTHFFRVVLDRALAAHKNDSDKPSLFLRCWQQGSKRRCPGILEN